jgi:hypothetical protein
LSVGNNVTKDVPPNYYMSKDEVTFDIQDVHSQLSKITLQSQVIQSNCKSIDALVNFVQEDILGELAKTIKFLMKLR